MTATRRNHPLMMVNELGKLMKNSLFFFILFFIIQAGSESWYFVYGRYAVVLFFIVTLVSIPVKWWARTYKLNEFSVQVTRSFITTTKQTVPYSKIQQVRRKTQWYHRFFNVTSVTLETSLTGEESAILFPVLRIEEAKTIEDKIQIKKSEDEGSCVTPASEIQQECSEVVEVNKEEEISLTDGTTDLVEEQSSAEAVHNGEDTSKKIHFTPNKKDLLKASVASLSFFAILPIGASILSKADDFHFEEKVDGFASYILGSTWVMTLSLILFVFISGFFGIVRTFVKYGKYEIASTDEKVMITKGLLEEDYFSIEKEKVQAVLIEQSLVKRLMGLASLKFVCAGGDEADSDVSSVYPFVPVKRSFSLVQELLPDYRFSEQMERLPMKALFLRLLTPSWLWMIATAILFWVKPEPFTYTPAWWVISLLLLCTILISRVLNFFQSRYVMNSVYIQTQSGGFTKSLFLSKRDKIIQMEASRTIFQKAFGLASLNTVNRANPIRHTSIEDVPELWVSHAYKWYIDRKREVFIK